MPNYAKAHAAVEAYLRAVKPTDGVDLGLGLADAICGLAGAGDIASGVIGGLTLLKSLSDGDLKVTPNLHFVQNGHERDSPLTYEYLKGRAFKNLGGTAVSIAGGIGSAYTAGVNTGGMAKDINAAGSSAAHLYKLKALLNNKRWEQSKTVKQWIELTITMKEHKIASRGISAVGNASIFVALPATLANSFYKTGIKQRYGTIINKTASDIHWRAFQEQVMDGAKGSGTGKGAVGPATSIVHEIFERRGLTRIFGKYKANEIIAEPAGWLALADKLAMM